VGGGFGSVAAGDRSDDDVAVYAAVASPSQMGVTISGNARVAEGLSNAADTDNNIDLGDYTGLDFNNGTLLPVWADNSNSTAQNPDGTRTGLDLYTARVDAGTLPSGQLALGGLNAASLDGNDIHLTGPNGFSATADLRKTRVSRDREFVTATYAYGTPVHRWSSDESGVYSIALSSGQVKDLAGVAAVGGLLGNFVVDA
jgi:hypothetical protein